MLSATEIHKGFDGLGVLRGIDLNVEKGEVVALIGPSGSGKSTLLRCLNQLETVDSGTIVLDGLTLCRTVGGKLTYADPANLRRITLKMGMVFQSYNLFPHMSVMQNLTDAPMRVKRLSRAQATERARELLAKVGLSDKADQYPYQLSGGQQQRVALARALVLEPSVLLFDEPLSNLDAKLRVSMRTEIRRIQQKTGITAVYVTHDQSEAMALSDRIIIMNKGVVAQMGTPQEIYYHPNSEFVADFIGEANFLKGVCKGLDGDHALLEVAGTEVRVAAVENMKVGETYTIVLRPESAGLAPEGALQCKVVLSCFMGAYQNYHVMVGDTLVKLTDYDPKNHHIYRVGDTCALTFRPDGVHIL